MSLDLIWHQKGTVPLPAGLSAEGGLARLEEALTLEDVYSLRGIPGGLAFEANIFFPRKLFGWPKLQPCNYGELKIEAAGAGLVAIYRFSFSHLFFSCLFGAALLGLLAASRSPAEGAKVALIVSGILYGVNYLNGAIRASAFVASALHDGEPSEYFSAADKIGCSLILALVLAAVSWVTLAAL